ncbi:hypothetical protein FW754_03265 [Acinetobacter sp. 1207_04]|uniref:hypothetical protein n=1 Tax=Acinetobacter sp. 1207_04 TaxID=2604449 RepID=UPI004059D66E
MQLIEIEPCFWELYKNSEGIYLNVLINMSAISWEKTMCLDEQTIQQYLTQGKDFIDGLAKRIESNQFRKDYERFYSYPDASKKQKEGMLQAFNKYKATQNNSHLT